MNGLTYFYLCSLHIKRDWITGLLYIKEFEVDFKNQCIKVMARVSNILDTSNIRWEWLRDDRSKFKSLAVWNWMSMWTGTGKKETFNKNKKLSFKYQGKQTNILGVKRECLSTLVGFFV